MALVCLGHDVISSTSALSVGAKETVDTGIPDWYPGLVTVCNTQ
jgi:hypothetical protein